MESEAWEIVIEPGSDLERRLAEMPSDKPGVLIVAGRRFRIDVDTETMDTDEREFARQTAELLRPPNTPASLPPGKPWDPEAFRRALENVPPVFTEEEAERIKETIYQARDIGTRSW